MKRIIGGVVMAAVVLVGGAALAASDPPGPGYGPGRHSGASAASMKKFQKETLGLRDELATKRIDLQEEYDKPESDSARIASLKKEIVDIEAKIQVSADKYGVRSWGRGHGRGMMTGWDGQGHARGPGAGCGCW